MGGSNKLTPEQLRAFRVAVPSLLKMLDEVAEEMEAWIAERERLSIKRNAKRPIPQETLDAKYERRQKSCRSARERRNNK